MIVQRLAALAMVFLTVLFTELAYGQYGDQNTAPTPEQLRACAELDIPPGSCTEQNILTEQGVQKRIIRTEEPQPSFDLVLMAIIVGTVIGASAIMVYFITLRTRKQSKQASQI